MKLNNLDNNLKYYIDYDYQYNPRRQYSCYMGCNQCTTIGRTRISDKNPLDGFIKFALNNISMNNKENYIFDRLVRYSGANNPDNYSIGTCSGYYGEEIDSVTFDNLSIFLNELKEFFAKPFHESILDLLKKEYGDVCEKLKSPLKLNKFKILTVSFDKIIVPNTPNRTFLTKKSDYLYPCFNKDIPIGVYLKRGNYYEILDGYHRYRHVEQLNPKKVKIVYI